MGKKNLKAQLLYAVNSCFKGKGELSMKRKQKAFPIRRKATIGLGYRAIQKNGLEIFLRRQ